MPIYKVTWSVHVLYFLFEWLIPVLIPEVQMSEILAKLIWYELAMVLNTLEQVCGQN